MFADILIDKGTILTVDKDRRIIKDGAIAIKGSDIVDIGQSDDIRQKYQAARVINADRKLVMPGLINTHHHLADIGAYMPDMYTLPLLPWFFAGFLALTPEQQHLLALYQMAGMIKTGTTCFCDCGAPHAEEVIKATIESGMRGSIGKLLFDGKGTSRTFGKVFEVLQGKPLYTTDECIATEEDLIKNYNGAANGRIKIHAFLEGGFACSDESYIKMKQLADRYGVFVHTHCAVSLHELNWQLQTSGRRCVEHLHDLDLLDSNVCLYHVIAVNDEEIDMLSEHGVKVAHCPNACFSGTKGVTQIGKITQMVRNGVTVALGDDSYSSGVPFDILREMHLVIGMARDATLNPRYMRAERAVDMGTINGAIALGFEKETGSLEIGKKADIIILNTRRLEWGPIHNIVKTLVWCATGDSVDTVIIDGKIVMEDKVLKTLNELELIDAVQELGQQLFPTIKEKIISIRKYTTFPLHETAYL